LIEEDTPEYMWGVIEAIVCSYARVFIGTKASTYTGYIQRFQSTLTLNFIYTYIITTTIIITYHTITLSHYYTITLSHYHTITHIHTHKFIILSFNLKHVLFCRLRGYYPDTINPHIYFTDTKYLGELQFDWGRAPMVNGNE
jgi:hypothetical protein